ncbi:NAD-dependent epimerase/dehydratase family protein [Pelotomaculum propionicicum]|uniref:UDP-glucose 4-epimerase n=1 Tax=Pelotomaculum propionicicum TaxID=258475 RepID=A0A4Y7RJ20_9FIRM|nr:NAD-dependent epimerase/dehydratase family protein [Pelotomaculum propionicicum]NLI13102.1 NAD-dependent epimerase/dehydratase family protein [Peptococcaceae bacterium]TEB08985.1 UDP-glucose 4-epimerase [Pelotomaculum propionicicum]
MNILVTGGAGFIGSHIVDALVESGCRVAVVDDLSTGKFEHVNPGVNFYKVTVQEPDFKEVVAREKPGAVIHLAAQADVQHSLQEPQADAVINILGMINLLEACRRHNVGKVVYASSAAVYGSPIYLPVDENHPLAPQSPYGVSKLTPEHYLRIYRDLYGIGYTILRYANVYGPRQDATGEGGVVAIFTDKLLKGEKPFIFGDGGQTRDFIYVKDVAAANLAALRRAEGITLNVSTGCGLSVNRLFTMIKKATGSGLEPVYRPPRPGDISHSYLSNEKARGLLGWAPRRSLEEGLSETVEFYKGNS